MKGQPMVSVIIPTYNRADLLPRAIDSVLAQTYKHFEIVVVDDGSTDGTEAVLQRYGDKIRCVKTAQKGPSHARNTGMKVSSGGYISFLDSDDSYYPYKLEAQVDQMEAHPEIDMICSEVSGVHPGGEVDKYHLRKYHQTYERMKWQFDDIYTSRKEVFIDSCAKSVAFYSGYIFDFVLMGTLIMSNTVLFRRRILDTVGYQNEAYRLGEDYEFVVRICKRCRVGFLDIPTYKLHYHDAQLTHFMKKEKSRTKEDCLLKIEGCEVLLAAVTHWAFNDRHYYESHSRAVDARLAELYNEIGYYWMAFGDGKKARESLRRAYRFEGRRLSLIRSWINSLLPRDIRRLIGRLKSTEGEEKEQRELVRKAQ